MRCSVSPKIASCSPFRPCAIQLSEPAAADEIPDTGVLRIGGGVILFHSGVGESFPYSGKFHIRTVPYGRNNGYSAALPA